MKIEVTEQRLKDRGYNLVEGDTITVPDDVGKFWCDRGWVKDVSGGYASAERVPGVYRIEPANVKIKGGPVNG